MSLLRMLPFLLAAGSALASGAQGQTVSIDDWRVQDGDNPAWARPDLDDSYWAATSFPLIPSYEASSNEWHWYRATARIPEQLQGQALAIGMPGLEDEYEVYLDGVLVGQFGRLDPTPWGLYPRHVALPVPRGVIRGPVVHIAIRRFKGPWGVQLQVFSLGGTTRVRHLPRIGLADAVEAQEKLDKVDGAIEMLPADFTAILFLFAAAIALVLYSVQRRRPEYLWLCLFCLASSVPRFLGVLICWSPVLGGHSWQAALVETAGITDVPLSAIFLAVLCRRFRGVLLGGAVVAFAIVVAFGYGMWAGAGYEVPLIYAYTYLPPVFELVAVVGLLLDRNQSSLAIGIVLLLQSFVTVWSNTRILWLHDPASLTIGPFILDARNLGNVVFIFAVLIVLYYSYREEQAKQLGLEQEMMAAREVQQYLIPDHLPSTPGFEIDSQYLPAREVGGDFFQVLPNAEDGSLLIVVGDVAGHGLQAGMLATLIVGAIRVAAGFTADPGKILALLNERMQGRGLVTCVALRIERDGKASLANAGHLPPYLNGDEMQMEGALPLGAIAGIEFPLMHFQLRASDTLMLMSDGIVEAQDAEGRLFGF